MALVTCAASTTDCPSGGIKFTFSGTRPPDFGGYRIWFGTSPSDTVGNEAVLVYEGTESEVVLYTDAAGILFDPNDIPPTYYMYAEFDVFSRHQLDYNSDDTTGYGLRTKYAAPQVGIGTAPSHVHVMEFHSSGLVGFMTCAHNQGRYPLVQVFYKDSGSVVTEEFKAAVNQDSVNQVTVRFGEGLTMRCMVLLTW